MKDPMFFNKLAAAILVALLLFFGLPQLATALRGGGHHGGGEHELKLAYLLVAHDLAVVQHISHRVAVMYLGRIVEMTDKRRLFEEPLHPYTEALLSAVPIPKASARQRRRIILTGDVPSPIAPPPGCHFHTRCPYAHARCRVEVPILREVTPEHHAACHLHDGGPKLPLAKPRAAA